MLFGLNTADQGYCYMLLLEMIFVCNRSKTMQPAKQTHLNEMKDDSFNQDNVKTNE